MKISIGCDHIVTEIKDHLVKYLEARGHEVTDNGTYDKKRTHYPVYGVKTAKKVADGDADLGIVLCGTGVGITISANKLKGIRAALVEDVEAARYAREKLNANVLGIGGRIVGIGLIERIVDAFLETEYEPSAENEQTNQQIDAFLAGKDPAQDERLFDDLIEKWNRGEYADR